MGINAMRSRLWDFYKDVRAQNKKAGKKYTISELNNLTLGMLGKEAKQHLRAKAGQTKDLTCFVLGLLREHQDKLVEYHGRELLMAGESIWEVMQIMRNNGRVLPHSAQQENYLNYRSHSCRSSGFL